MPKETAFPYKGDRREEWYRVSLSIRIDLGTSPGPATYSTLSLDSFP
jgi:hypothetical protein